MSDAIHPARALPFKTLVEGLERAGALGLVHRRVNHAEGLQLYIYTPRCVYEDGRDEFTVMARGLILDEAAGKVVATPFPKFFKSCSIAGKLRESLMRSIRPTGNALPGYMPSYGMGRILDDARS